jgi:hypothetical protein
MSNQLKIFTDLCNNEYHILDEYDPEVYGHKIIANDSNIVFLYDGHGTFHHDLDAVQRTIGELRGRIENSRPGKEHTIPRLKIFLWAEEKLIQHLREKKLNNILES